MGQCSTHVYFSSTGLYITIAQGIAATLGGTSPFSTFTVGGCVGGIGQSALALNRFMEVGMVLGQGVSSLSWKTGALGVASGCGVLQLGVEGFSSAWGLPVGWEIPSNFPCAKLYTVTGMVVAADFTTGIWVDAVEVATVGVGTDLIGFTGTDIVGVVGKGWAISLSLHLLFTGALVLLFLSAIFHPGAFLVNGLLFWEGMLVHGCDWVWG